VGRASWPISANLAGNVVSASWRTLSACRLGTRAEAILPWVSPCVARSGDAAD